MRKVATITIRAMPGEDAEGRPVPAKPGRDEGKAFVLTEMSAMRAEAWAIRAFLAMAKGGVEVPIDIASAGIAGLATFGLEGLTSLAYDDAKPLLDEMLTCVQVMPDPRNPVVIRALLEDDIEEISTFFRLRSEVFKLHVNFSQGDDPSAEAASPTAETHRHGRTPTSRGLLGR